MTTDPDSVNASCLRDLKFMDLYVCLNRPELARYRSSARDHTNNWSRKLPEFFRAEIEKLIGLLRGHLENPDSSFEYEGMRMRLSWQRLANGQDWIILRRIATVVPMLEDLSYAPHIVRYLHRIGQRDGLVIISGATGHGKTTTAFSLMANYMRHFGGVGITIEDPVEYILDGECGDHGYCYQVQVGRDEDWATPIKRALRWTPRYILVGEVRSPRAAEQIMRAATTGHLVITTIHAGSIEESLMGLMHLAEQSMGSESAPMLAQGLTAALHQTLGVSGPFLRYVFTEENNNGDPIRSLIREGRIGMINSYIDKQIARMQTLSNLKALETGSVEGNKIKR